MDHTITFKVEKEGKTIGETLFEVKVDGIEKTNVSLKEMLDIILRTEERDQKEKEQERNKVIREALEGLRALKEANDRSKVLIDNMMNLQKELWEKELKEGE